MFYGFLDSLIWTSDCQFSLLLREYTQLAVNVLISNPEISELVKVNFFKLSLAQNDEKLG